MARSGEKVKKEVRGYERDKNVSQKDFKGFDKLPKSDQARVVRTFEFDKPFGHVSFRKIAEIDWHGEKKEGLPASTSSSPSLAHEVQWPDDEEVQLLGECGWTEAAPHQHKGIGSSESGMLRSSHDLRMSSVSSECGKSDASPSSPHDLSEPRNGDRNPPTMPPSQNKVGRVPAKNRQWKGKKEKPPPPKKAPKVSEWVPPKDQNPVDFVGTSWGDAAPSWGDAAPSWGDADTPADNQPASTSVWDNPALEPNFESGTTEEASGWGTEEWTYPGATTNGDGDAVDTWGSQNDTATGYQNDPSYGSAGWGNQEWVGWGADTTASAADSGWIGLPENNSYSAGNNQHYNGGAFGYHGDQEGAPAAETSASWGSPVHEPNGHDTTSQANSLGSSGFRLNPNAIVFVPRSVPAPVSAEVTAEPVISSPAAIAEPTTDTTPSTTTHSIPQNSTLDSGISSTPTTCLTDAEAQTKDVTEQLHKVDIQVAEYKIGVSQATLEVKKANLDVMRAKLEALEQRRALLAGARNQVVA